MLQEFWSELLDSFSTNQDLWLKIFGITFSVLFGGVVLYFLWLGESKEKPEGFWQRAEEVIRIICIVVTAIASIGLLVRYYPIA